MVNYPGPHNFKMGPGLGSDSANGSHLTEPLLPHQMIIDNCLFGLEQFNEIRSEFEYQKRQQYSINSKNIHNVMQLVCVI